MVADIFNIAWVVSEKRVYPCASVYPRMVSLWTAVARYKLWSLICMIHTQYSGKHAKFISDPGCWLHESCFWHRCDWQGRLPPRPLLGGVSCCPELPAPPHPAGFLCGAVEPSRFPKSPPRYAWRGKSFKSCTHSASQFVKQTGMKHDNKQMCCTLFRIMPKLSDKQSGWKF